MCNDLYAVSTEDERKAAAGGCDLAVLVRDRVWVSQDSEGLMDLTQTCML